MPSRAEALDALRDWMRSKGWEPLAHQEETWRWDHQGLGGILSVPTGSGKTYAAYFGGLSELMTFGQHQGLGILWVSPLRAMTRDIELALARPIEELELPISVGSRTGDTSASRRRKLREELPNVLLTTPESLSLMLSYPDSPRHFGSLRVVIVDEWHELSGSKRGTQTELALARLRALNPSLRIWALSATVGNPDELAQAAVGLPRPYRVVSQSGVRAPEILTLFPEENTGLPWFGRIGTGMFGPVAKVLGDGSTLVFTNTRNQSERWYQGLLEARPDIADQIAIHHGSLTTAEREDIEHRLKSGELKAVVCTSSLDLGVDFAEVDSVVQVGSPMSVARLVQRAGRSGHRPGASSRIWVVPTQAFQMAEVVALRRAVESGRVEEKKPLVGPLDVLIQHVLTVAAGPGFLADELYGEILTTWAYRNFSRAQFDWVLDFVEFGGVLESYQAYRKVERVDGHYRMISEFSRDHRMSIGTITSNAQVRVRFVNGKTLGHVDEHYLAKLKEGDTFIFAGRLLELVHIRAMEALVRASGEKSHEAPRWTGSRVPWSDLLSSLTREVFAEADACLDRGVGLEEMGREMKFLEPILMAQRRVSKLPGPQVLVESTRSKDGTHFFIFPFAGHSAHEGLASLLAYRLSSRVPSTFAVSVNDMGIELLAAGEFDFAANLDSEIWTTDDLDTDILKSVNAAELARRQFRETARVAGLVFEGLPSKRKTTKQLQTSAGLLFDVFKRWDPGNPLIWQAESEVITKHFDKSRLLEVLTRLSEGFDITYTEHFSPLAFPLVVDRVKARVSSESQRARLERMIESWSQKCS